ncbi:MAG: hypothetical protein ACFFEF_11390 [Candidatus Thorarchaeota archaeon]
MQEIILALIRFDLILEAIAGIIALIVSHYANNAFRLTGQKRLSDLSTGFLVLSVGMFGRVIGTLYFFVLGGETDPDALSVMNLVIVAYGVMKIMAYALFALSTHRRQRMTSNSMTLLLALPFLISPPLEFLAILVLLIVVLQTLMNYLAVRNRYALYVLVGFLLLLIGHLLGLSAMEDLRGYVLYLASQLFQFLGLIAFLVMLRQAEKDE